MMSQSKKGCTAAIVENPVIENVTILLLIASSNYCIPVIINKPCHNIATRGAHIIILQTLVTVKGLRSVSNYKDNKHELRHAVTLLACVSISCFRNMITLNIDALSLILS